MAEYHLHVKNISRNGATRRRRKKTTKEGAVPIIPVSVVAAAAYRAGETLVNEAEERESAFGGRRDVAFTSIQLPATAPQWMADRGRLWNAVERAEKRIDARLAKEIEFSLPRELSMNANVALALQMADHYAARGFVVDVAVHEDGRGINPHAHLLLTTRDVTPEGFGRKMRHADARTFVNDARKTWEGIVNPALVESGFPPIDRRSYADRGIDREPGRHRGPNPEERRQNREVAAMLKARDFRQMIEALTEQTHLLAQQGSDHGSSARVGLIKASQEKLQTVQDAVSDALVKAGIMERDTAKAFWDAQRRLLGPEDYFRLRGELLGIEAYANEPKWQGPSRADQRMLRQVEQEEADARFAKAYEFIPAATGVVPPPGDPVPNPDGDPISPQQLDAAQDRMLADHHAAEDAYMASQLDGHAAERRAAEAAVERINQAPVSDTEADAYRILTPHEKQQRIREENRQFAEAVRRQREEAETQQGDRIRERQRDRTR